MSQPCQITARAPAMPPLPSKQVRCWDNKISNRFTSRSAFITLLVAFRETNLNQNQHFASIVVCILDIYNPALLIVNTFYSSTMFKDTRSNIKKSRFPWRQHCLCCIVLNSLTTASALFCYADPFQIDLCCQTKSQVTVWVGSEKLLFIQQRCICYMKDMMLVGFYLDCEVMDVAHHLRRHRQCCI